MAMIRDATATGSQFIIATHSPMLMAIPGAAIFSFDDLPVQRVDFEDLEAVALVRDFLQAPERYLLVGALLCLRVVPECLREGGLDQAWADGVDAHTVGP